MRRKHFGLARSCFLLFCLAATSCSTPYKRPLIWEVPAQTTESGFPGILETSDGSGGLDVLITHGMCAGGDEWAQAWTRRMGAALSIDFSDPTPVGPQIGSLRLSQSSGMVGGERAQRRIRLVMLDWSKYVETPKASLHFDKPPTGPADKPLERAAVNNSLKQTLVNDCLSDVVHYVGSAGDALRADLRTAIERMVLQAGCVHPDKGAPTADLCDHTGIDVLIGESLGSRMMLAAIDDAWQAVGDDCVVKRDVAERLAGIDAIYLLANPDPLLSLADGVGRHAKSATLAGLDILLAARGHATPGSKACVFAETRDSQLLVVAMTDPNDVISYTMPTSWSRGRPGFRLINVVVSNARTWFGLVADPWQAHTGYADNPVVVDLIANGGGPEQR